jgi:hypothetical protein
MNEIRVGGNFGNIERYKYIFVFEDEFIDDKSSQGDSRSESTIDRSTLVQRLSRKSFKINNKTYFQDIPN